MFHCMQHILCIICGFYSSSFYACSKFTAAFEDMQANRSRITGYTDTGMSALDLDELWRKQVDAICLPQYLSAAYIKDVQRRAEALKAAIIALSMRVLKLDGTYTRRQRS